MVTARPLSTGGGRGGETGRARLIGGFRSATMAQVTVTDENTARRCKEALLDRMPIMFTQVVGDKIKAFSGQVQSVEDDNSGPQPKWRVTLIDPPARPLGGTEKLEGTEGTGKAGAFQRNAFSDAFQTGTP